ncbi:hypothetical protein [Pseudoalteromonas xiamenensis]|uniref:Uncharacterized protein n=1 Tax=Pseudoalteromonas xiamenensis TaxID=882626 RepID=A0A975DF58_9GAMM|nr:hypothetical protein [Pseudoalteromonas xiamenensis]QTH70444.1 hypothetical protein J5O05_10590 [Pseudoalteromonas xiamenensis]
MGTDFMLMGFIGYYIALSLACFSSNSLEQAYTCKWASYAKNVLLFPIVGYIVPAFIFTFLNLFYTFYVSEEINTVAWWHWPLIATLGLVLYFALIFSPVLVHKFFKSTSLKKIGGLYLAPNLLISVFVVEKTFFATKDIFSFFIVTLISLSVFMALLAIWFERRRKKGV